MDEIESERSQLEARAASGDLMAVDPVELDRVPGGDDTSVPLATVSRRRRFRSWARRDRAAFVSLVFLVVVVLLSLAAPLIAPSDPNAQDVSNMLGGPSSEHLLGTDDLGRDVLSRLLHGARVSLQATFLAVGVALVLGLPIGLVAGYAGGIIDDLIMRVVDTLLSFPAIVLAIGVVGALGPGLTNAMVAVGIVLSPIFARIIRGQVMTVKEDLYVEAARSFGSGDRHLVLRHILPNSIQPVIVQCALLLAVALIAEASLSFLGLGVQPPEASWGFMLGRAYRNMHQAPLQMLVPGLAIMFTVLAFNILGDSLRTVLDPMSRKRLQ